ncbi:MAG: amidinotransferase [Flavobacteriaceae bacterium]|nr:amidinotransferase [Flavobacteriaceae bacterium]
MNQSTNTIVMVRPIAFRMNEQTAVNNYYQEDIDLKSKEISDKAQHEFDTFVQTLRNHGVEVVVVSDNTSKDTPDSIFPNNWISFHEDGTVAIYPMFAENRRMERRSDILDELEAKGFIIENIMDYTSAEEHGVFLEGTGSIVLDRIHKKAYCALSARADEELFIEFCEDFEYTPVIFTAYQSVEGERLPIYHTNVMMAIADAYAIVCLDSIDDKKERKNLIKHLKESGKQIIAITEEQVEQFAGNMLQVKGSYDQLFLVMSSSAYHSLTDAQRAQILTFNNIIHSELGTIEACGGGSARCMMAEVFLPKTTLSKVSSE